jgi:hypothetical protein
VDFSLLFKNLFLHTGIGLASFLSLLSGSPATPATLPLQPGASLHVPTELTIEKASEAPPSFPEIKDREKPKEPEKKLAVEPKKEISAAAENEKPLPVKEPEKPTQVATSPLTLNDEVRGAVVNILCNAQNTVSPISGSGILIDPRGIILTNAHVAQFFLLRNYPVPGNVNCIIRAGSPAKPLYTAELLFLSPSWIRDNADEIAKTNPTGTGEGDYALLRITGAVNLSTALPAAFPYVKLDTGSIPEIDGAVLLAGYPAGFLDGITIETNLYAVSSFASIHGIYTFGTNTEDLISVGGTPVAQKGSSGGGVVDVASGKLVGVLVTSTDAATTGARDLRAITLAHINRSLGVYSGTTLETFLESNLVEKASLFNLTTAPTLRQMLVRAIER